MGFVSGVLWFVMLRKLHESFFRMNRQCGADENFTCFFLNENVWISIDISLKFVPKGPINNIPAFVRIMAWSPGDKPLSEPVIFSLPMHRCVTRPQWVNLISVSYSPKANHPVLSSYKSLWYKYYLFLTRILQNFCWQVYIITLQNAGYTKFTIALQNAS